MSTSSGRSAARDAAEQFFDPSFFPTLAAIEERHFWFQGRNRVIAAAVAPLLKDFPSDCRLLEVGCGTGLVLQLLRRLSAGGVVLGMDCHADALSWARRRSGCPVVCGDLMRPPLEGGFDLVGAFDILEHLDDDRAGLSALAGLVRPGGAVVITVPADGSLWSYFDESSRHRRRYEVPELHEKLESAGLRVEYLTEFMMALYPLVWLGRRLRGWRRPRAAASRAKRARALAESELQVRPWLNGALERLLSVEARAIVARRRLPWGTSILAVARSRPG